MVKPKIKTNYIVTILISNKYGGFSISFPVTTEMSDGSVLSYNFLSLGTYLRTRLIAGDEHTSHETSDELMIKYHTSNETACEL